MHENFHRTLIFHLSALSLAVAPALPASAQTPADEYTRIIQPIFDGRCISCHSCNNAPCQLNLQSGTGVSRGATSRNVYDRFRPHSVAPTRLDIDASTVPQWRAKGFFDVTSAGDPARALLLKLVEQRAAHPVPQPAKSVAASQFCPADTDDRRITDNPDQLGMPYGLPPLRPTEIAALRGWIERGAVTPASPLPVSERDAMPASERAEARAWEAFLNDPDPRRKLVSRYLYEHLFLAHLHFPVARISQASRPTFYRLVRSRTACEVGVDEIATRRPTDKPDTDQFSYCLRRFPGTIVDKTHIPYDLTPAKLQRIDSTFMTSDWQISRLPGYGDEQAKNPFATFADIPVRARYQFLLDDAQYEIMTFIKGPVCNGSTAVNSIQEQFFVFFLKPDADSMVASAEHAAKARDQLILPGAWGSDVPLLDGIPFLRTLIEHREQYRQLRAASVRSLRPKGYALPDIWDGDGVNPNAVLTVFRHDDNAAVLQGAVGDLSKTAFVLDYPLLERLVYNLVVNFDVFGNVGHQSLTRLYMDMIRMEAEELFLAFLPPSQRSGLRRDWYRGSALTDFKLRYVFPLTNATQPTAVGYRDETTAKAEFVRKVLMQRLPPAVRGPEDGLNWRTLSEGETAVPPLTRPDTALRRLASVKASSATPFARYFPDLANLLVRQSDGRVRLYSIVHNREHANVSWIGGERLRLAPQDDTLTIREGVLGAYPNMFFVVDEAQLDDFTRSAATIKSSATYDRLVSRYGVKRSNDGFWAVYDEITALTRRSDPVRFGYLDLSRYELQHQ